MLVGRGVCVGGTAVTSDTGCVVGARVGGMGVGETAVWQAVNTINTENKIQYLRMKISLLGKLFWGILLDLFSNNTNGA